MANPQTTNPAPVNPEPAKTKHPAFVFVGDKTGHGPDEITLYGVTFEKNGKPVEVSDAKAAAKLAGNSHFKAA